MNEFIPHLIELRRRVIACLWILSITFAVLFYFDELLYAWISKPLLSILKQDQALIATDITSSFTVPMKLAFILSFFLTAPYCFYQIWSFIAPGLYQTEKRKILPFLIASIAFFYSGMIFSYYVLCPMALNYFVHVAPPGVLVLTDIRYYLDFVITLLFAGAIAFQAPVVTLALLQFKIITLAFAIHLRPYVIVLSFILGMLLTPPDVLSQILVALPIWGLYELSLLIAQYWEKKKIKKLNLNQKI